MKTKLRRRVEGLGRAVTALERTADKGRIARANARREVLLEIRRIKALMNEGFPAIAATPTRIPLRGLGSGGFKLRMASKDYIEVPALHVVARLTEARVRMHKLRVRAAGSSRDTWWAPRWAVVAAAFDVPTVRKAARDATYRASLITQAALGVTP